MEENKYGGFFYNVTIYTAAMIVASLFPYAVRTIASFFIDAPSVVETQLDATRLLNSVYPIVFALTTAAFFIGGYVACYIFGFRIGRKTGTEQPKRRARMQMTVCGFLVYLWNMYIGLSKAFCGPFGFQFWYPAALTGKWLGLFDISNLPANIDRADIASKNYIFVGLIGTIGYIVFCYSLLYSVLFTWMSYRGRISGEKDGIKAKKRLAGKLQKTPAGR